MKAVITEIEGNHMYDFCYYHGGVRVHPSWYDEKGQTSRFLTQDKRHHSYDTQSYVYIDKSLGKIAGGKILFLGTGDRGGNVATCKNEEGKEFYVFLINPKIGDTVEFDVDGFWPYDNDPEPNKWGRLKDDID